MNTLKCQHVIPPEGDLPGERFASPAYAGTCDNFVTGTYRQCGRGCPHVIAYCASHGGDERSQKEMAEHHKIHGDR